MKNMMVKLKAMALAVALMGALPSLAYDTESVDGYTWSYNIVGDGGGVRITFVQPEPTGALTIPAVLGGKPVTDIGDKLLFNGYYYYGGDLTSVTIPNSVTNIGDWAFASCTNLTDVTIGSGVTRIGEYAFHWCYRMADVTIPDSVTSIGDGAFSSCANLTNVTIGSGVTSIGKSAFHTCYALTDVTIPDSVTSIGRYAFGSCYSLTNATIGSAVTNIGENAFASCRSLTSVTIPDSVTSMGRKAFAYCDSLTNATIGSGITSIAEYAFEKCYNLADVTIGSSVTNIEGWVFEDCSSLTNLFFTGPEPAVHDFTFYSAPVCNVWVYRSAAEGWSNVEIPGTWHYHPINWYGDESSGLTGLATITVWRKIDDQWHLTFTVPKTGLTGDVANLAADKSFSLKFARELANINTAGAAADGSYGYLGFTIHERKIDGDDVVVSVTIVDARINGYSSLFVKIVGPKDL